MSSFWFVCFVSFVSFSFCFVMSKVPKARRGFLGVRTACTKQERESYKDDERVPALSDSYHPTTSHTWTNISCVEVAMYVEDSSRDVLSYLFVRSENEERASSCMTRKTRAFASLVCMVIRSRIPPNVFVVESWPLYAFFMCSNPLFVAQSMVGYMILQFSVDECDTVNQSKRRKPCLVLLTLDGGLCVP